MDKLRTNSIIRRFFSTGEALERRELGRKSMTALQ